MASLFELARNTRFIAKTRDYSVGDTNNQGKIIQETVEGPAEKFGIAATVEAFDQIWQTDIFLKTAQLLGIQETDRPMLSPLQAGEYANHVLVMYQVNPEVKQSFGPLPRSGNVFDAALANKPKPEYVGYVLAIGKQPVTPGEKGRTQRDFDELTEVYKAFPQGISYKDTSTILRTVQPLVASEVPIGENRHTIYTTLFDPNAELGCGGIVIHRRGPNGEDNPHVLPYLFHPTVNNDWEEETNKRIEKRLTKILQTGAFPSDDDRWGIRGNFERILTLNALIAVATGKFPSDFSLNRGDLIANFDSPAKHLNTLTLISTNGSLRPIDEDGWVQQMLRHVETNPLVDHPNSPWLKIRPFASEEIEFREEELHAIYQEAKREI